MNPADDPESGDAGHAAAPGQPSPLGDVLAAGIALVAAVRRIALALTALLAAEVRVWRASVALVFIVSVALIAVAVSLWACVVAFIGWALVLATHSLGAALGVLVVVHALLVWALWWLLVRAVRNAGAPALRGELHALGGDLRRHVERFRRAAPASDRDAAP